MTLMKNRQNNKMIIKALVGVLLLSNVGTGVIALKKNQELLKLQVKNDDYEKIIASNKEQIKKLEEDLSIKVNSQSDIRLMRPSLIETIKAIVEKNNNEIKEADILRALSSSENRIMEEYIRILCLILATMEIETNFNYKTNTNNNGTKDHGIMQVNDAIIPHIKDALGQWIDPVNSKDDNVEAGSYEVYECYLKAKDRHPEDVIWWTYAYYNRGLYFENTDSWKNPNNSDYKKVHNQANVRSEKFKKTYLKYYNELINLNN